MHFSKIYVQKNFVPNIALDPFGRQSIGIEVTLKEGEHLDDAVEVAEQFIKEYIQKNTTENPHIVERIINDGPLPEIQVDKEVDMRYQMNAYETVEDLILNFGYLEQMKGYYADYYRKRKEHLTELK